MKLSVEDFLLKRKDARPSYVFDLRDQGYFAEGTLMGAHNLPFSYLEGNLHRLPFTGTLLFYDAGEGVAIQAGAILQENGFDECFIVEEGYEALVKALEANPDLDVRLKCTKDDPLEVKKEVIQNVLDFEINPSVASHGGFFSLIDVIENDVYVQLGGGCHGCGMADVTLRQGVESRLREVFPDMGQLIDNTDHDTGEAPYMPR